MSYKKICLLVTDDPDDHQIFYEVVKEISADTIVLNILDSGDALKLLKEKKHIPDYLFLDLTMHGIRINSFLKGVRSEPILTAIPLVIYGETLEFSKIDDKRGLQFFAKEYDLPELKEFLLNLFN